MDLKKLLELQEIDNHVTRIKAELADIPRQLEMHKSKLITVQAEEKALHQKVDSLTKERHTKELDLKTKEEEIKKFSTQLSLVKTNEQYRAMQQEIENAKHAISKLEDGILAMMDTMDRAKDEVTRKKAALQQEQTRYNETEKKINAEKDRLEALLKEAEGKRDAKLAEVDPALMKVYNRIAVKYPGSALATVRGNVCQGCSMTLPPQVVAEVHKNDHIVRCESCSRIIYLIENEENQ